MVSKRLYIIVLLVIVILLVSSSIVVFLLGKRGALTGYTAMTSSSTISSSTTTSTNAATRPRTNGYAVNLPNSLMLVDSQGRRTGEDPITGITYHEIPGTEYSEEEHTAQLYFTSPINGNYTLYVLGGANGSYSLYSWVDEGGSSHVPKPQVLSGNIQKGSMIAYAQNYNTADFGSSSLVLSNTFSSTTIVTSAPPNNLPPPPIP